MNPSAPDPRRTEALIRETLRSHNASALLYALLSLLGAAVVWGLLYLAGIWLLLLVLAASGSHDEPLPQPYPLGFAGFAAGLLLIRALTGSCIAAAVRQSRVRSGFTLLRLILAPASLVFEIFDNLLAMLFLPKSQLPIAASLLAAVHEFGKLPASRATVLTADPRRMEAAAAVLIRLGLIQLLMDEHGPIYKRPPGAMQTASRRIRITTARP